MYPKIPLAQSIIEICQQKGVQHIVISPGSRQHEQSLVYFNRAYHQVGQTETA